MATTIATDIDHSGSFTNSRGEVDFSRLVPQILEKFVLVLEGAAVIAIGVLIIRFIRKYLQKIEITHEQQRNAINLLEKITTGFIIVISITIALKIVGIDMTLLVSVMILGLSYGLQDIIKNYVAGILILFKAPFKIGETVKIRDYVGKVYKMDFQSTTLETFDNRHITIYNSDVMTQSIVNFSSNSVRRINIDVMLGYGSDTARALTIFEKILKNHPSVLKSPKFSIVFKAFGENAIAFTLKFWLQQPCNILKIKSEIGLQISKAFDEQKIMMPYSKDIQIESDYTMSDDRKQRIANFFSQPQFAEVPIVEGAAPETPAEEIDSEEPE